MELFDDDELGFIRPSVTPTVRAFSAPSGSIGAPTGSTDWMAALRERARIAGASAAYVREKAATNKAVAIAKAAARDTPVASPGTVKSLTPMKRFESIGKIMGRVARDAAGPAPGTSSKAYRHLCANAAVGGSSSIILLKQILDLVRLQNTRSLATNEHYVLNNTQAFRRAVLRQLSGKIRRTR